jgi:YD repeat-containing protein
MRSIEFAGGIYGAIALAFATGVLVAGGAGATDYLPSIKIGTASFVDPTTADGYYGANTASADGLLGITGQPTPTPPEIVELARALKNSPDLIYEYVRNNIENVWLYGLQKGALGTELDKAGTDFDQADLMVKLLRQAGYTASYVAGTISLSGQQFTDWTGISDATAACQLLSSGGIPGTINGTTTANCGYGVNTAISTVVMSHIWVKVTIPNSNCNSGCLFDPSYKPHSWKTGINLFTATQLVANDPLNFATSGMGTGTTLGLPYVNNLSASSLNTHLQTYASNLLTYIQAHGYQGSQIEDIIGGGVIQPYVSPQGGLRQVTLPYTPTAQHTWTGNIPNQYRATLSVLATMLRYTDQVYDPMFGGTVTFYADEIYGRTLTIDNNFNGGGIRHDSDYYTPTEYLRLDGATLKTYATSASYSPIGSTVLITLTVDHPYSASSGTYMDQTMVKPAQLVTPLTIVHAWGDTGSALLAKWSDERVDGLPLPFPVNYPGGCEVCGSYFQGDSGDLTREKEAASYLAQYTRATHLHAQIAGAVPQLHHVVGLVFADVNLNSIYYDQNHQQPPDFTAGDSYDHMDVEAGISLTSKTADAPSRRAALQAIAASSAALEGSTAGQITDLPDTASTATRFEWANSPPSAEDPPAAGPRKFFQFTPSTSVPTGFSLFEGYTTAPAGDPLNAATSMDYYASEWQGLLSAEIAAYTGAGYTVTTTQESFLGPGQRGGSYEHTRTTIHDAGSGVGVHNGLSFSYSWYSYLPTKQRGAAFVATQFDTNGDPVAIAHIITSGDGMFTKGGGSGAQPDNGVRFDPANAADVMKSRFVDRSGLFGVNLSNGALSYTAPATLDVGNGGFPYELTASLSWRPGPLTFSFGPIVPTRPTTGWTTNWNNELSLSSSGMEAMGKSDIRAAAGTIAAFLAAQDIYKSSLTTQREVAAVLVNSWWTHQMTGNVVTASLGTSSQQFLKLADSTWIAPGSGYATLTQTNDRVAYEYKCPSTEPYPLTRGWDEHNMSFKVNNAHGDVENFSYWMNNYYTTDTSHCAQAKGFRLTSWTFPQSSSLTINLNYGTFNGEDLQRLLSVTNTVGREIDFLYNVYNGSFNELSGLKQANSLRQVTLSTPYTGTDSFTDPFGAVTSFNYTDKVMTATATQRPVPYKLLDKVFTADNATVANMDYDYDGLGHIKQIKDAEAFQVGDRAPYQFYIADGTRGERDDPLGQGYSVVYDTYGHASRYIDELGHETDQVVDSRGRTASTTYPEGDCELFAYDDHNNPTSYTRIDKVSACNPNAAAPHKLIVTASWNQTWNKPLWVKTPLGYKTSLQYWATGSGKSEVQNATLPDPDGTGGPLTSSVYNYTYDAKGKLATVTDPLGMVTTNAYDSASENLLSTIVDSASGHLALTTQFAYDADGNVTQTTDPRGNVTVSTYDADRRKLEDDHHDGNAGAALNAVSKTDYDLLGRVADVKQAKCIGTASPCTASGSSVATWITSKTNTYTPTGKLATVTDADGRTTTTTVYDNADRTDTVIDPVGRKVHYVYCAPGDANCAADQVKQEIRAYGTAHPVTYATYTYSLNGKQASVYDAMGSSHTTLFAYDGWDGRSN